ncbi:hypothetical protein WDW37_04000 [Bdellovibrionota bacterium FG-1]
MGRLRAFAITATLGTALLLSNSNMNAACLSNILKGLQQWPGSKIIAFQAEDKILQEQLKILKSPTSEFLLTHTQVGHTILSHLSDNKITPHPKKDLGFDSAAYFSYFSLKKNIRGHEKTEDIQPLLIRLKEAEDGLAHVRNVNGRTSADPRKLNDEERAMLEEYAKTNLIITEGKPFELAKPTKDAEIIFAERFKPFEDPPPHLTGKEAAEWQAKSYFDKMKACLRSMPSQAKKEKTLRTALQQFVVNEAFTVVGYVTGSGRRKVDWINLPTDLAVGGAASFIEPYLSTGTGTLGVRYVKMVAFGANKSELEGIIYYLNPKSDPHGRPKHEVARERATYSATWAVGNSAIKIGLFTFILGLQCMNQSVKMDMVASGLQISHRIASSWGYFYLRNHILSSSPDSRATPIATPSSSDAGSMK